MKSKELGQISDNFINAGDRDAFHVPAVLVTCLTELKANDKVTFLDSREVKASDTFPEGIVDPFIDRPVKPGECVWVLPYPRMVSTFVHDFEIIGVEGGRIGKHLTQEEESYVDCGACYQ